MQTTIQLLLGLMLILTLSASYFLFQGIRLLKRDPVRYGKPVGRRMMLTTVIFLCVPILIVLGRSNWGEMTSLYAFLAGLVSVNALWVRPIR